MPNKTLGQREVAYGKREPAGRSMRSRILGRGGSKKSAAPPKKGPLRDTIESLIVAFLIFLAIRTFAFQAFKIPSGSMENTLLPGDFLFIDKFAYGARLPLTNFRLPGFTHPKVGDIIVFQYPGDHSIDYIKRCVAVAGDVVQVKNKDLYVNGVERHEPFVVHLADGPTSGDNFGPYKVPPGDLFMMGDNRDNSADSRFWGPLDTHLIRGKAWFTYFSWDPDKHLPRPMRMFRLIH